MNRVFRVIAQYLTWLLLHSGIHGFIIYSKIEAANRPQTITVPPPCWTVLFCYFYTRYDWMHTFQEIALLSRQFTELFSQKTSSQWKCGTGNGRWAFVFIIVRSGF
ncbi:hypothetical protein GOODEAATRI_022558 [Goodea atripinnis]|uniref:Secreted protein n=1 Tax=Goodea atripinnis TaxID=208336 RepID=A0ABV0MUC1_9TELE